MKKAMLLHNPKAGDEEHGKKELVRLVESAGYDCSYASTKKDGWAEIEKDTDFIIVAGGDGTVRKVARKLLERKPSEKTFPIVIFPLGTANNIATTLGIEDENKLISNLENSELKKFDVGRIFNHEENLFFLESFGYGIFPYLMQKMEKKEDDLGKEPELVLKKTLKILSGILNEYEARSCHLVVDGKDHSGNFILAEVMNTSSIGPNLILAPNADPGDGEFEVVLVKDTEREKFQALITSKLEGKEELFEFTTIRGKNVSIKWDGTHVHIDDEVVHIERMQEMKIELKPGALEFFI